MKTERDVAAQLGIKVESPYTRRSVTETRAFQETSSSASSNIQIEMYANEKKKLIENILALKSENQTLVQKLNEKDAEIKASNKTSEEKVQQLRLKLNESENKLMHAINANEKCVSDLKRENVLLTAQNKQLKTGLHQTENTRKSDGESDDDFYEVETLLRHKEIRETQYLVQWKGFDQSHNTWERESNLFCPSILKKYKKLNKLK